MSLSPIRRIRGAGAPLKWDADVLDPMIDWCAEMWLLQPDAPRSDEPADPAISPTRMRDWRYAREAARDAAAEAFATAQGWTRLDELLSVRRLIAAPARYKLPPYPDWGYRKDVFDHPQWFRVGRRTAGAVVHLYGKLPIDALPEELTVDRLPRSWYYPQHTTAYVFRPAQAAVKPFAFLQDGPDAST